MNRKQRRAKDAKIKKDGNEELAAQVAMFGKLPEECTACTSVGILHKKLLITF